jgi:release factor glutamine methyltransferase
VTGVDISSDALAVARENAERTGAVPGVRFLAGDLDEPLTADAKFDLVTANPPYIPTAEIERVDADVRDFEPRIALDGGPDGLDVVRRVVNVARRRLRPGGVLAVEVGAGQAPAAEALLLQASFAEIRRNADYGGHERVVSGKVPS